MTRVLSIAMVFLVVACGSGRRGGGGTSPWTLPGADASMQAGPDGAAPFDAGFDAGRGAPADPPLDAGPSAPCDAVCAACDADTCTGCVDMAPTAEAVGCVTEFSSYAYCLVGTTCPGVAGDCTPSAAEYTSCACPSLEALVRSAAASCGVTTSLRCDTNGGFVVACEQTYRTMGCAAFDSPLCTGV